MSKEVHSHVTALPLVFTAYYAYQDPEPGERAWLGPSVPAGGSGTPPRGCRPSGAARRGCGSLQGPRQALETWLQCSPSG